MLCSNCGNEIAPGSQFCASCGNPVDHSSVQKVKLVAAKCMSCGGNLRVNPEMEKSVCPFCDAEYIVEKAINFYNIQTHQVNLTASNIVINNTATSDNLMARGDEAFNNAEFLKALYYYDQALDYDPQSEAIRYRKYILQYPLLISRVGFQCSLTKISLSNFAILRPMGKIRSLINSEMNFKSIGWNDSIGSFVLITEDDCRYALLPNRSGLDTAQIMSFSIFHTRKGILNETLNRQGVSGIKSYYKTIFWLPSTGVLYLTDKAIVVYDCKMHAIIPYYTTESVEASSNKINIKGRVYYFSFKNSRICTFEYNSCSISCLPLYIPDYVEAIRSAMSGNLGNPVGLIYVL